MSFSNPCKFSAWKDKLMYKSDNNYFRLHLVQDKLQNTQRNTSCERLSLGHHISIILAGHAKLQFSMQLSLPVSLSWITSIGYKDIPDCVSAGHTEGGSNFDAVS